MPGLGGPRAYTLGWTGNVGSAARQQGPHQRTTLTGCVPKGAFPSRPERANGHVATALITRDYNGVAFQFRADGWFNMTKAAQHFDKDMRKFFANQETQEYLLAVAANAPKSAQFIMARRGNGGGTWGHPKVAVPFSRWLDVRFSVRFSVRCDAMIEDIIKGSAELVITKPAGD